MPISLESLLDDALPDWLGNNKEGRFLWSLIFAFVILLPLSLPRQLGGL
jgi:hypothetical protein